YSYRQDEQPQAVREQTKKVPGWARWILLFALLLPLGSWNTFQMVGEGYLKRGMDYHSVNDYSMMFHSFDKAMAIYPYQMEIYYILGRYYIDTLVLMDQAVMKGQEGIDQLTALGLDIRKRSDINDRGIVCLQTDLFMNPNYKWAHNNLGVLYDRYAYPAKYPSYFDPYIEINPENNMYRYVSLSAKSTYDRVLKIDDEQVYAHYNMGLGYMNQGHYNLAIDELGRALVSDPSKPDTYRFLASCFISNADPVRAFAATDKYAAMVLLSKKDQILAHANQTENTDLVQSMNLVIDSLNKRQLDQAMEILAQQGIQWADEDIFKLYLRIANDLTSGETPSPQYAVLALYRAEKVMLNPSAEFLNLAAQIYLKNGAYEKAGEKLQEMLRYQPDNVDIRRQLAQIYLALSQFNLARSVFEQVLKLEPNSWENHVSYARILIANQVPWEKVFPFVARAIELGGDAAKAEIGKKDESNLIAPIIDQDPRLQSLLGVAPAASEPAAATTPVAVTEPAIPATAETTPATSADSAPADSVQPGTPE
ncbi:MAG: tetratricopeptide repeat protein, partial [bacterium]|nr:tetratricopeptide repeat protein [bacterium]